MFAVNPPSFIFRDHRYLSHFGPECAPVFQAGAPADDFAAFELLQNEEGKKLLETYYQQQLLMAGQHTLGLVILSPTWRAGCDWGIRLGYTHDELFARNKQAVQFVRQVATVSSQMPQVLVSGHVGTRGSHNHLGTAMTALQAKVYHLEQVKAFALADADLITATGITTSDEAIGIVEASRSFNLPVVISFALQADGKLPKGEDLRLAIERTDQETDYFAQHYMIECANDESVLIPYAASGPWKERIRGLHLVNSRISLNWFEKVPSLKVISGSMLH